MLRKQTLTILSCAILVWTGRLSADEPDQYREHFSSETLTFRADKNTTLAREVLTTSAPLFLQAVKETLFEPNKSVVDLIQKYPSDGTHKYWWPKAGEGSYDGSTTDVLVHGNLVMKGEPQARTFCCGLTLEVFYGLLSTSPSLSAVFSDIDPKEFKRYWFCRDINSPGPQDALESFGLGKGVPHSDALPGDFVQLWRNDKSGHSVIFVNWLYDEYGKRSGLQYWSTQEATGGIGFASEIFGTSPKQINEQHLSVARPSVSN